MNIGDIIMGLMILGLIAAVVLGIISMNSSSKERRETHLENYQECVLKTGFGLETDPGRTFISTRDAEWCFEVFNPVFE